MVLLQSRVIFSDFWLASCRPCRQDLHRVFDDLLAAADGRPLSCLGSLNRVSFYKPQTWCSMRWGGRVVRLHCMKGTCHICQCKFQQSRFLTLHPTYMVCTTLCAQSAKNCPIRQQKVAVVILQPGPFHSLCITWIKLETGLATTL